MELAHKAASTRDNVLVAGSMGPTGGLFKPFGPLTAEEVTATYAEQAAALAEGGVDLLVIETMFAFDETDAAFEGARSATDLPIVVSFSYDRGVRSMMGVKPKDVVTKYQEKGAATGGRKLRHHAGKYGKNHHQNTPRPRRASHCGPSRMRVYRAWMWRPTSPPTMSRRSKWASMPKSTSPWVRAW